MDATSQPWILGFSGRDCPWKMPIGKLGTAGMGTGLEDAASCRKALLEFCDSWD